jgi:hypothetical protein
MPMFPEKIVIPFDAFEEGEGVWKPVFPDPIEINGNGEPFGCLSEFFRTTVEKGGYMVGLVDEFGQGKPAWRHRCDEGGKELRARVKGKVRKNLDTGE